MSPELVSVALRDPSRAAAQPPKTWELLIRQARNSGLLARLALALEAEGCADEVPAPARPHLDGAKVVATKLANDVRWEVRCLREALSGIGVPAILLKGAAYVMADLPAARGRIFSDVDLMVPRHEIRRVELVLRSYGWIAKPISGYDQRYYREWSHQIPPLIHGVRQTTIDLHHTIIPETARKTVSAARVHQAAVALGGGLYVLAPADQVLHSAVHLFNEGEFDAGLRDVSDLDLLMRHFGADPAFWPRLAARAEELGLERVLSYAMRHARRLFATPVPDTVQARVAPRGAGRAGAAAMDRLLGRALRPRHPSCEDALTAAARLALYVRGHYLRMPFAMLLPHLAHKSAARLTAREKPAGA